MLQVMSTLNSVTPLPATLNRKSLNAYLILVGILYAALVGFLAYQGKTIPMLIVLGAPALLVLVTHPKLAVYSYIFLLLVKVDLATTIPVMASDVGALILIGAALFDLLLTGSPGEKFPRFTLNYVSLLVVLIIAGLFGYSFMLSIHPIARILLLFITFLALYRLAAKVEILKALKLFYWLVVGHSVIAFADFAAKGGHFRSFGLVDDTLDDFAMLALPIGLTLYLWQEQGYRKYLIGTWVVLAGLVATQSRAPLFFTLLAGFLVVWFSRRRARKEETAFPLSRIKTLMVVTVGLTVLAVIAKPGLFLSFSNRFERLLTTTPGDTFRLRLIIWGQALSVFAQHPLLGLGPGTYKHYAEIYPTAHMEPLGYYIRGLSAHNLMLHYLAETGLVGFSTLFALFINVFLAARRMAREAVGDGEKLLAVIMLVMALIFLYTTPLEAAWMWGELSFTCVFFVALIARQAQKTGRQRQNA
jgi:hypothetical protein